jgi:hypothetical protein
VPKVADKVDAGEKRWLNTDDLVDLGKAGGVVLIRRTRRLEDFPGANGPVVKILCDILVVSARGGRDGEFWPDQDTYNGGITNKLINEPDGTAVAGRLEVKKNGRNEFPVMNPTEPAEWKLVESVYKAQKVDIDAPDADEQLFTKLRKAHESNARAAGNGAATASADDQPPF